MTCRSSHGHLRYVDVVSVAMDVLSALDALHAVRLVHADISLENIVVRWDASADCVRAAVVDFNNVREWGEVFGEGMERARRRRGGPYAATDTTITGALDVFATGYILRSLMMDNEVDQHCPDEASAHNVRSLVSVFNKMTHEDPRRRFTASAARAQIILVWMQNSLPS